MRVVLGGVLGLGLLLVGAAPALAASFDCTKARTPFAKAVCGDPKLSKADEDVAAAFEAAKQGLSPAAATEVSNAQDGWVKYANIACTKDAKPATTPYKDEAIACLQSLFDNRTTELKNGKSIGGLRFYYIDRFAAVRDPDPSEDSADIATKEVSTPRIDGTDAEATAFNALMATGLSKDVDPTIADHPNSKDDGTEDDTNSVTVTTVTPGRIGLSVDTYMYGHGAAHGNYATTYIHYLRDKQRRLVAADVFAADGWQKKLQPIALAAVKKTEGDDLMLDDPTSINDLVVDPARWDFSKDGLILQFEPYEIAPYAAGAPTVTIPWADIAPLLAGGAQALGG